MKIMSNILKASSLALLLSSFTHTADGRGVTTTDACKRSAREVTATMAPKNYEEGVKQRQQYIESKFAETCAKIKASSIPVYQWEDVAMGPEYGIKVEDLAILNPGKSLPPFMEVVSDSQTKAQYVPLRVVVHWLRAPQ